MFAYLAAAAAVGGLAAPAIAQYPYPQAYPQQYPQAYPQTGYAYPGQQGYGQQNTVGAIIGQLLGNRYNVSDRTAVQQCATAAMTQAAYQNQPRGYRQGHNGYNQGYNPAAMRVTAITDVQRRNNGLRVSGLMSSGMYGAGHPPYGQAYGYHNQANATGDLTFRCNVAYNGQVTNVRIGRNTAYRG
jgi:hypothetical protein